MRISDAAIQPLYDALAHWHVSPGVAANLQDLLTDNEIATAMRLLTDCSRLAAGDADADTFAVDWHRRQLSRLVRWSVRSWHSRYRSCEVPVRLRDRCDGRGRSSARIRSGSSTFGMLHTVRPLNANSPVRKSDGRAK